MYVAIVAAAWGLHLRSCVERSGAELRGYLPISKIMPGLAGIVHLHSAL